MKIPITFYHGTTVENVKKLVQSNWDWTLKNQQTWLASMPEQIYAWCGPAVNLNKWDETNYQIDQQENLNAIIMALENAQVSAAVQNSNYNDLIVLGYFEEIEVEELPEDFYALSELINEQLYWYSDYSCSDMDGAFSINYKFLLNKAPDICYVGKDTYSSILRGTLIPIDNDLCNIPNFTEIEKEAIEIMRFHEHLGELTTVLIDKATLIEIKDISKYLKEVK